VTEGRGVEGFYGDVRLRDALSVRRGTAAGIATAVLDDVMAFQDGRAKDDIALVVLRVPETP
jgi:serine phosphatase RsbU (regulator of sigma subunit)